MLWLALCFPRLPLDLLERAEPLRAAEPLAIADPLRLCFVNAPAREGGLHPGMKRATAQALCPQVLLAPHDPAASRQALEALAWRASQFSPSVALWPPRAARRQPHDAHAEPNELGLLLEIGASLRLFGGPGKLLERIGETRDRQGVRCRAGLAVTPRAAWLFALQAAATCPAPDALLPLKPLGDGEPGAPLQSALAGLPLTLLSEARPWLAPLQSLGARTIGELLELPRAGMARRFGRPLLEALDGMLGLRPEPVLPCQPPEHFDQRLELPTGVETVPMLEVGADSLLDALAAWLQARQAALRRFELQLEHHEPPATTLTVLTRTSTRDADRLRELLTTRLALLTLRAPVHGLRLRCTETQPLPTAAGDLFAGPDDARESLNRLLERLQVRLGPQRIQRLALAADHRPEAAYRVRVVDSLDHLGCASPPGPARRRPAADAPGAGCGTESGPALEVETESGTETSGFAGASLPRPLWLLPEPRALAERNNRPWLQSALQILAGPERIESGWWDGHLVQRDYFVAEDSTHRLYWIYRERGSGHESGWFVQGCFG